MSRQNYRKNGKKWGKSQRESSVREEGLLNVLKRQKGWHGRGWQTCVGWGAEGPRMGAAWKQEKLLWREGEMAAQISLRKSGQTEGGGPGSGHESLAVCFAASCC